MARHRDLRDRLRALRDPLPPAVRDRHLDRLQARAAVPSSARRPAPARRWRRLAPLTAAATALLLLGGGGTVVAAQDALPDDALYGVKRASEEVWLAWPRGPERAAEVRLARAERRLTEARRAPWHAERLVADGVADAEEAADERPEQAVAAFERLLGEGEGRLPPQASPRARQALHRNCTRLAERHGMDVGRCGPPPAAGDHPGRGLGRDGAPGRGLDPDGPPGRGHGRDAAPGRGADAAPGRGHGWGPGGRPDGVEGPPHGGRTGRPPWAPGADAEAEEPTG
jgi:hypothetical protein